MEVALVLDSTGSMADIVDGEAKMDALRTGATDLVNILFGNAATLNSLHISVVSYNTVVWIPQTQAASWSQAGNVPNWPTWTWPDFIGIGGGWTGLDGVAYGPVANRTADIVADSVHNDITDDPPLTEATRFRSAYAGGWPDLPNWGGPDPDPYNPGPPENPTMACNGVTQPACNLDFSSFAFPIQFALNDKNAILNTFSQLRPVGDTRINVGLMWGWFTLSPKWQGVWDPARPTLPLTPAANVQKVMVLMTDGLNTVYDGSNGIANDDNTTLALCQAIQAQGITLYTIGYGAAGDVNTALLQQCASTPDKYFLAPTVDQLETAFHSIADDIKYPTIRLSQ